MHLSDEESLTFGSRRRFISLHALLSATISNMVFHPGVAFLWAAVAFLAGPSLCWTMQKQTQPKYVFKPGAYGYQTYVTTASPYYKTVKKEPNSPCPYKQTKPSMPYYPPQAAGYLNRLPSYPFRVNNKVYYSTPSILPPRYSSHPTTTEATYRATPSGIPSYPLKTTLAFYLPKPQDYQTTTPEYYSDNYPSTYPTSYEPQNVEYSYRVPAVKYYSASTVAPQYNQQQQHYESQNEEAVDYQVSAASYYDYPPEDGQEPLDAPEAQVYEVEQPIQNYDDQPYNNPTVLPYPTYQPIYDTEAPSYLSQRLSSREEYDINNPVYDNHVYEVSTPPSKT